ncbi:MAG: xanthine dehydrogenase family protein molybdopterin-binding subunit, partial [Armatimonadota bacterium]
MIIGVSLKRKEDPRLLSGRAQYVDDIVLPGMLHAVVVRTQHAHAKIHSIDDSKARLPGVVLIQAGLPRDVRSIPIRLGSNPLLVPYLQLPLARERVRYVGEPVAVVVAENRYVAEDAADLVVLDCEMLPAVTTAEQALDSEAPVLHADAAGNLAHRIDAVVGDPDGALAGAEVRIRHRFTVQRHTGVPLETRGLVAHYDASAGMLTVWGPTKVPHFNRRVLADLLGYPLERIRFVEPDVGGGFGVRGEFYPEDFLIPYVSMMLGRPV